MAVRSSGGLFFFVFFEVVSYNGWNYATGCSLHKNIEREDGATCCDTHPTVW
jgi:hypothetical protein